MYFVQPYVLDRKQTFVFVHSDNLLKLTFTCKLGLIIDVFLVDSQFRKDFLNLSKISLELNPYFSAWPSLRKVLIISKTSSQLAYHFLKGALLDRA